MESSSPPSTVAAFASVSNAFQSAKESFNKSGGSEMLASVSSSIPQGTKDYFSKAKSKIFNREQLRSVSVFFGIGEEKAFYVEKTPSLVVSRVNHNISFFFMNYILLTSTLFILTLIVSPGAIIGIGLLSACWIAVIRATSEGSAQVYGVTISQKQATLVMTALSGFILVKVLSHVFWWTLGSSGCLVAVHALLRDASMHKDEGDKIEMTGDVGFTDTGEDASFLNPQSNDAV